MNETLPFQITFRGFKSSDAVWAAVQERVEKLEKLHARATSCEVVISMPHRHNTHGRIFHVEVRLHIPGHDFIINREPEKKAEHGDVYVAIRHAFDALERKLEDFMKIRRGAVKHHDSYGAEAVARQLDFE